VCAGSGCFCGASRGAPKAPGRQVRCRAAAAYQQVIATYGLHAFDFDFDLEEPEIENSAAIANELGAAQILQQNNPGLFISVTIPSIATGANYFGQQLFDEALALGFTPNDYTIMPFDGGFSGGSSQVTALQGLNAQLVSTFGWSSSVAYSREGFRYERPDRQRRVLLPE
jgi:chitinase